MNEQEQPPNDLDVQITDLPGEPERNISPKLGDGRGRATRVMGRLVGGRSRTVAGGACPTPTARRRLQLALIAGALVLALLIILGNSLPVRDIAPLTLFGSNPTATPALTPGSNLYYIFGDQPWGKIYLDGHLLTNTPLIGSDPPVKLLARGMHHFVWQAVPFPPQRCTISVPSSPGDTCQFILFNPAAGPFGRLLIFHDTLNDLPTAQVAALTRQIQGQLDTLQGNAIVRMGEFYAYGLPAKASAAGQPLRASLHYRLDTHPLPNLCIMLNLCQINGEECATLCTLPLQQSSSWEVGAVVQTLWDYTTPDGRAVAADQPDSVIDTAGYEHLITLDINWSGSGWQVSLQPGNPLENYVPNLACASAEDDITGNSVLAGTWRLVPAPDAADGCLAVATIDENDGGLSPPSHPITAYCLHRFGVLLAANSAAHHLWPFMPVADSSEQSLALQLAKLPGWTFSVPGS